MSKPYFAVLSVSILGLVALWCSRQEQQPQWHENIGSAWTTEYHIRYLGTTDLTDSIQAVLQAIDQSASVYNKSSAISAINNGSSMHSNALLDTLYQTSVIVHQATGGAFDPTVMPLVDAWGFGHKNGVLPTKAQIDSILQFVGLAKVSVVNGEFVKSDPRVQLDFSSIAKGLACDEVGRMLARNGVKCFMVEIGGEITVAGTNPKQQPWRVSVDLPSDQSDSTTHESALILRIDNGGIATSGNYRKYLESDGKRISHIVNPMTGDSEVSDLLSVTIVASSCMVADAWATACMVLGTERTQELTQERNDLGVMTISANEQGQFVIWSNAKFAYHVVTPD